MTVYIAAPYEHLSAMVILAADLTRAGYVVQAQWLYGDPDDSELRPEDALRDLADIEAADVFLVYNPREFWTAGSGGRHVELGYALALQKPVVLLGRRTNVFHYLPEVHAVEDREGLLPVLQEVADRLETRILS